MNMQQQPQQYAQPLAQPQQMAPLQGVISGGPMFASVDFVLGNEQILADAGTMTWKDGEFDQWGAGIVGVCLVVIAANGCGADNCGDHDNNNCHGEIMMARR